MKMCAVCKELPRVEGERLCEYCLVEDQLEKADTSSGWYDDDLSW